MGKLKNALIQFEEQRGVKRSPITDPRNNGLEDSDEELARYEAEFADWLDNYEQSFGSEWR